MDRFVDAQTQAALQEMHERLQRAFTRLRDRDERLRRRGLTIARLSVALLLAVGLGGAVGVAALTDLQDHRRELSEALDRRLELEHRLSECKGVELLERLERQTCQEELDTCRARARE